MKLSNEEKESILEESRDPKRREDLQRKSKPRKMSLSEYMDFLSLFSELNRGKASFSPSVPYHKVVF